MSLVLICISLTVGVVEYLSTCLLASVCLLWTMSVQVFCPFFDGLFFFYCINSCMNCLHINILDINPLLVISFANIFSHSVGCLFILLMVSIDVQKLLSLIRSHLLIFAFILIFFCLRRQSQKNIVIIYVKECSACFLLGVLRFWVSHLGLQSIFSLFLYIVWGNVLFKFFIYVIYF